MEIGTVFPHLEIGSDPKVIAQYGRTLEDVGYDHVLSYDHVLGANPDRDGGWEGPYDVHDPFHETMTLLSYLTGVTENLEMVTGIVILPQRQTVLAAKQAAEIDVLNEGRFRFGVAIGWNPLEYVALGEDFDNRGERLEEQIELMRTLWTNELVSYEGDWHRVPDCGLTILPEQQPIPVWIGGMSDAAKRRTARIADGWLPRTPVEETEEHLQRLDEFLDEEGRSREDIGVHGRIGLASFDPGEWPERLAKWRELDVAYVSVDTMYMGLEDPADHMATLEDFMDRVKRAGVAP